MRKSVLIALIVTGAALAQGPRGGFGRGVDRVGGPGGPGPGFGGGFGGGRTQSLVTGAPYSAVSVVQSQETLMDGNRITNTRTTSVARDSQGRVRTEETVKPPAASGKAPFTVVTILDYVAGKRYTLDASTSTAYQTPLRVPRAGGSQAAPPQPTPGTRTLNNGATVTVATLPQSHINGVLATGTQITETIPAGAIGNAQPIVVTRVTWVSSDLKVPVQIKSSDPRFGVTDMELTSIVQAEPSASLFAVPPGYTLKTAGGFGGEVGRLQRRGPPQQ